MAGIIPKVLRILEYDKIINKLCDECMSRLTREQAGRLKPYTDAYVISEELEDTEEAVAVLMRKGAPPLGNFYDISGFVHLAAKDGTLTMKQLLEVAYNLGCSRKTHDFLSCDLPELPRIESLVSAINVVPRLEKSITDAILSEDEMSDSASPELRRIRRDILRQNEAIRSKIQQIVGSSENQVFLQDAIVTQRQGRYVVPVKLEHKGRLPGIVHDQSSSGATLFIEPQAIVNMNNELRELELAEVKEIARILKEFSAEVGLNEAKINGNQVILQKLDFMFAKGKLACDMHASKPGVNDDGIVNLRKARHPLIDPKKVVPIDVSIGDGYSTLVVTGPNTGGKTVTLKTVGLLCLMAQSGLFVPAGDETTVPVFKKVYADIGDEQSIEQSLSTFSSHMTNIVGIVKGARNDSLVLLDELGAGTDPAEGAALAIAILDKLYGKGATTIATTHYTELKKYAISTSGVQNASMEFNVETLSPTYRLIIGLPGKSNAFLISQKLGLDEDIIERAGGLIEGRELEFEDVISKIEGDRKAAEADRIEAGRLRAEIERMKQKMDDQQAKLEIRRAEFLTDARAEARQLLDEAKAEIAAVQKEIEDSKTSLDREAQKKLNRTMEEGKRRLREKTKDYHTEVYKPQNNEAPKPEDIRIGMRVNVLSVGQKGTVLTLPDDKDNMNVQIGVMKLDVNIDSVTLVQENVTDKQREKTKYSRMYAAKARTVSMSVNVIGKNLDDALIEVDRYLDDAFMAGLHEVSIIHGRGAGILKNGIGQMLKKHKHVESYRKGEYKEGGEGVTIVTLRH